MIKWLLSKFKKVEPQIIINDSVGEKSADDIPEDVFWQGMLLTDNELLVYRDDNQKLHYFCSKPYDPEKEYIVLFYEN